MDVWAVNTGKKEGSLSFQCLDKDSHTSCKYDKCLIHCLTSSVSMAPDGTLASGGHDTSIRLWNVETRKELPVSPLIGHRYVSYCSLSIAFPMNITISDVCD